MILFDNEKEWKISVADAVKNKIINNQALAYYVYLTQELLFSAGIDPKKFRFRKHAADELAHYATECWDAELYSERFGWVECVGIADRSAYDLNAHIISSGVDMYALRPFDEPREITLKKVVPKMNILGPRFSGKAGKIKEQLEQMDAATVKKISLTIDGETIDNPKDCYEIVELKEKQSGEKFVPHVIEPSFGIDRILYFPLEHNYVEGKKKEEEYTILKLELAYASRHSLPVGIIIADIDDFKSINDTYAHQWGDFVLSKFANIVIENKRTEDLVARYGGDEFIILPRGEVSQETMYAYCERIRHAVEDFKFSFDSAPVGITVSIGFHSKKIEPGDPDTMVADLIHQADQALYLAK